MSIEQNYRQLVQKISSAAVRSGRSPQDITLVAVTKFASLDEIREVARLGILDLGENRIQSAAPKLSSLTDLPINWHFIGHLQTNKVRQVVESFRLIHSVDSLRLAQAISAEAQKQMKTMPILLEVNISGEGTKNGLSLEEVRQALPEMAKLPNLRIEGLMTMAPFCQDLEATRPVFKGLRELKESLSKQVLPGVTLRSLSMGMSNDFEIAIEEGATHIRIGSALFGK